MFEKTSSHSVRSTLSEWLSYIENLHFIEIEMGLTRIRQVSSALNLNISKTKVITVAGTNGKGTTCAFLENALLFNENNVAVYSSPHIEKFNERLRINNVDIDDHALVDAFETIEQARKNISLSYYEYTTLAALLIVETLQPDYLILEVGLGGRLDATNLIDTDIAVITTIDLDHQKFLGDTREKIGFEKAGIMRSHTYAVVGDIEAPDSVIRHASEINADVCYREKDFYILPTQDTWTYQFELTQYKQLIKPHIPIDNVATALTVLSRLDIALNSEKINHIIEKTKVPGRAEMFYQHCEIMLDVGHNPQAARYLAAKLTNTAYKNIYAVVGMLIDKDITNALKPLKGIVKHWYFGTLHENRGATSTELNEKINLPNESVNCFDNVSEAFKMASSVAGADDLVLVYGSFYTVAEIRRLLLK